MTSSLDAMTDVVGSPVFISLIGVFVGSWLQRQSGDRRALIDGVRTEASKLFASAFVMSNELAAALAGAAAPETRPGFDSGAMYAQGFTNYMREQRTYREHMNALGLLTNDDEALVTSATTLLEAVEAVEHELVEVDEQDAAKRFEMCAAIHARHEPLMGAATIHLRREVQTYLRTVQRRKITSLGSRRRARHRAEKRQQQHELLRFLRTQQSEASDSESR